MEEESNGSEIPIFNTENKIRSIQSKIQSEFENFEAAGDTTFVNTSDVCDNVMDQILNYQDEPHLSKTQNTHRRILIASELFINFCPIYANVVDYEYGRIIRDMVQWEKYKKLSRKIRCKLQLELRREKYFLGEAQSKLLKSLEEKRAEGINDITSTSRRERDSETKVITRHEKESLPIGMQPDEVREYAIPGQEINETLAGLETSFRTELPSNIIENLTQIRDEVLSETFQVALPMSDSSRQEISLPHHIDPEVSIRAPTTQQKAADDDIDKILQILEEEIFPIEVPEIPQQSENFLEPVNKSPEPVLEDTVTGTENPPTADGDPPQSSESSERWSLPGLEAVERTRKHRYLIIDKATIIPDYAARALQLNRTVNIQRVQVFEGPPRIFQAMSANHLMRTPGHTMSLFRDVRSSKLSTLYNRHLEVEKKPVERIHLQRRTVEEQRADVSRVRSNIEITEDVGIRVGMHLRPEKSELLVEAPEKDRPVDLDLTAVGLPPKESLVGVPLTRLINSTIEPPEEGQMERINAAQILPTPRVQQLQGKSLEPRTSPPWFISTKENPPNEKYRKFSYVYDRLQKYWSISESQGTEKSITLREFFSFEGGGNVADFLTVLRIVDKMSIQRKLVLECKSNDVIIRPFEIPFVSDAQLLLKEKEPVF